MEKKKVYRQDSYNVSPWNLIYTDDFYYLLAYDATADKMFIEEFCETGDDYMVRTTDFLTEYNTRFREMGEFSKHNSKSLSAAMRKKGYPAVKKNGGLMYFEHIRLRTASAEAPF